jgi:hypothetical protein
VSTVRHECRTVGGTAITMDPIPDTTEAVEEFGPFVHQGDLLQQLKAQAGPVRGLVPDCVGLSVATLADGVTFTVVASADEIAAIDAAQYLTSGPCVDAVKAEQPLEYTQDELFDEQAWGCSPKAPQQLASAAP